MRRLFLVVLACVGVLCSGCSRQRGHLMIAGGAMEAEHAAVYERFMAPLKADAVIGVLPTASGVPKESAASSAATLTRYAGTRTVRIIDLTTANAADASNPEFVKQIEACDGIWFTGGDQSRIVSTFRPALGNEADGGVSVPVGGADVAETAQVGGVKQIGKDNPISFPRKLPADHADTLGYVALTKLLERGGAIGGTSAGAAMMSDPMILGGRSDDALLGKTRETSDDSRFAVGRGMGFFTYGLTDQHFLRRGRLGRLVAALEMTGIKRGYGIEENSAIDVDRETGTITVLGPLDKAAVVLVDVSEMRREGDARRGVRVSLLYSGDVVKGETGEVVWDQSRGMGIGSAATDSALAGDAPEAWAAGAVTWALKRLAAESEGGAVVVLKSAAFEVRFTADERTRFSAVAPAPAANQSRAISMVNVRMDIVPRPAGSEAGGTAR